MVSDKENDPNSLIQQVRRPISGQFVHSGIAIRFAKAHRNINHHFL